MVVDHLSIVFRLNIIVEQIAEQQEWIDDERSAYPYDQLIQLELDRAQADLDEERRDVNRLMIEIPRDN